jgi:uncharacterized membrane protein YtjA (UPF0391 family)
LTLDLAVDQPTLEDQRSLAMFRIAIALLVVALIAAIFGFGGIAAEAAGFAKIVFVIALILAVVGFIFGGRGTGAIVALLAGAGVLALPSLARAQEVVVEQRTDYRTGLTGGIGIGAGHIACEDEGGNCDGVNEAGGLNFNIGAMLNPQLALVLDVWGMRHDEDRASFTQGIAAGAVKAWILPRLWLMGGVGVAQVAWSYDADVVEFSDETDTVPAIIGGVGLELLSTSTLALDVSLRGGTGFYEDENVRVRNVQLGVGLSFF